MGDCLRFNARFALEQASVFRARKLFPDMENAMDSFYMNVLNELSKDLCQVWYGSMDED